MLPGGLLEEPGARRSARDWIVDVTMTLLAVAIGVFVYGSSEDQHSDLQDLLDLVFGVIAVVSLWWRRRWPLAVAIVTLAPGFISAWSAVAGLIAMFTVALRVSRRDLFITLALGLGASVGYSLVYPDEELPFVFELL